MSKNQIQEILSFLKSRNPSDRPPCSTCPINPGRPDLELIIAYNHTCSDVIKVLESGIFTLDGGLKGKLLTGSARNYISDPILDFPLFISMATSIMVRKEFREILRYNPRSRFLPTFDLISYNLTKLIAISTNYELSTWVGKLEKMQQELEKLKGKLLSKSELPPQKSRIWGDRLDSIIGLFAILVPSASEEATAKNISLLFEKFGENIKPKAITQRMYRAKKDI